MGDFTHTGTRNPHVKNVMLAQQIRRGATIVLLGAGLHLAGLSVARAIPPTQNVRGQVLDEKNTPIPATLCSLTSRLLPTGGLTATADQKGQFEFKGLQAGEYSLLCAATGYIPLKRDLEITDAPLPDVLMVLPVEEVVHQKVEVREQAPTLSPGEAAPSAKLGGTQLADLPLVEQKFQAALPYLPGVVRTPDGKININGLPDSQGQLLVNSSETADPVTGNLSIDVPVAAIDTMQLYKNNFDAQYGGYTGGLTTIRTKPPAERWEFEAQNLPPNPRIKNGTLVGMADFNPRLYVSGPVITNKLGFTEAAGYDIDKQPVRGLPFPNNEIRTHDFSSFTDLHYIFSPHHLATLTGNVFPLRRQFADIDSLIPVPASSDYGQHGFKIAFTDNFITSNGGMFTTVADGMQFYSWGHGEGAQNMLLTPNGWGGNFFNSYQRDSEQEHVSETYKLPRFKRWGNNEWTVGLGFLNRNYGGVSLSRTVNVLRPDGTIDEQINFVGGGNLSARDVEGHIFVSDHWVPVQRVSLDLGLRYTGETLGSDANFAPRFGIAYAPGRNGKTVIRAGVGRFYAHTPLLAGDFPNNPARQVSSFDDFGNSLGPPVTYANAYGDLNSQGVLVASQKFPSIVPYAWTWNLEADQELNPRVLLRVNFLSSRAYDQYIIDPATELATGPAMLLTPRGSSRYNEFESTVHFRINRFTEWNVSYVFSQARGDLNTLSQLFVPFQQPFIRPDEYANLASDIPNRVLTWGRFKTHIWGIESGPVVDLHSGYPYAPIDMQDNYVGVPNTARYPEFFSLDMKLSKEFHLPFPLVRKHLMRGSLTIFNLTDHSNPRDVFNNISSPYFGHFAGNQHRLLDGTLDVLY